MRCLRLFYCMFELSGLHYHDPTSTLTTSPFMKSLRFMLFILVPCLFTANSHGQFRVVGYYPSWYRSTLPAGSVMYQYGLFGKHRDG